MAGVVAAAAVLVLASAGCGPKAASPSSPGPVPTVKDAPPVVDQGYATEVVRVGGDWKVTIEYVDVLHGEKAHDAAVEEGAIKEDEPLEGDTYVRSTEDEPATFVLDPTAPILGSTGPDTPPRTVKVEELAEAAKAPEDNPKELSDAVFKFTLRGDRIVKMEEVYLP